MHGVIQLDMPKQNLNRPNVLSSAVNECGLGSAQRMRAIPTRCFALIGVLSLPTSGNDCSLWADEINS